MPTGQERLELSLLHESLWSILGQTPGLRIRMHSGGVQLSGLYLAISACVKDPYGLAEFMPNIESFYLKIT